MSDAALGAEPLAGGSSNAGEAVTDPAESALIPSGAESGPSEKRQQQDSANRTPAASAFEGEHMIRAALEELRPYDVKQRHTGALSALDALAAEVEQLRELARLSDENAKSWAAEVEQLREKARLNAQGFPHGIAWREVEGVWFLDLHRDGWDIEIELAPDATSFDVRRKPVALDAEEPGAAE